MLQCGSVHPVQQPLQELREKGGDVECVLLKDPLDEVLLESFDQLLGVGNLEATHVDVSRHPVFGHSGSFVDCLPFLLSSSQEFGHLFEQGLTVCCADRHCHEDVVVDGEEGCIDQGGPVQDVGGGVVARILFMIAFGWICLMVSSTVSSRDFPR